MVTNFETAQLCSLGRAQLSTAVLSQDNGDNIPNLYDIANIFNI